MLYYRKWHHSRLTWRTPSTRSRSWIKRTVSHDARLSSSSRYSGVTIQKKKPPGRVKTFSDRAIWILSYHSEGTCDCSLFLLGPFSFQISGQDFVLGGKAITPCVSNPQGHGNHMVKTPYEFNGIQNLSFQVPYSVDWLAQSANF
jgi:hypothetical protein